MSEPMSDEQLAEIRRRNEYLRNIPFDTHGPGIHGDNCPPCGMVRGIGDVTALLLQLEQQRAGRQGGLAWNDWCVRILIGGRAVTEEYDDETQARIRYQDLAGHPERARRLVQESTSYPSAISSIELLCRTHWEGDYLAVESAPQQPERGGGS